MNYVTRDQLLPIRAFKSILVALLLLFQVSACSTAGSQLTAEEIDALTKEIEEFERHEKELDAIDEKTRALLQSYRTGVTTYKQVADDFPKALLGPPDPLNIKRRSVEENLADYQPGRIKVISRNYSSARNVQAGTTTSKALVIFGYLKDEYSGKVPAFVSYDSRPYAFAVVCRLTFRNDVLAESSCSD